MAEVNRAVRETLEEKFSDFWVEGEISEVRLSAAGHHYFALSDEQEAAQLRGVLFRSDANQLRVPLVDGARVRVRGHLSFYPPRGSTQLIARVVMAAGEGDLRARFEQLKAKLSAEGLLAAECKRPLPRLPRTIGIATSRTSAALHDMVRVAQSRRAVRLLLADCRTQGAGAAASVVRALKQLEAQPEVDVILVGRGGGSAEELWSFNDEALCRAIAACRVPVVCGVGHETDVTLAELVADVRASTPSNAAEQAVERPETLRGDLDRRLLRLQQSLAATIDGLRLRHGRASSRLTSPDALLRRARREERALIDRLRVASASDLRRRSQRLRELAQRLRALDPRLQLRDGKARAHTLQRRLGEAIEKRLLEERGHLRDRRAALSAGTEHALKTRRQRLQAATIRLDALSPLRVLGRGYAIALKEGSPVTNASELAPGDELRLRLHEGEVRTVVKATVKGTMAKDAAAAAVKDSS
ncbi:MAG: exodeoxyribonuclease VII large subunit [Myxococcota bacterium]